MKKNVLALSIAAMIGGLGFAGAASAQSFSVNESGTGHMLLVPYYTAQNNNMTVLHVVNTDTANGKAVKVRFRGASNSDDVLDFQVFMSPGDVWTAAVRKGANDVAELVTADGTCTLPAIAKNVPVPFVLDRLPTAMTAADKASNTREGYVEILNMGDYSATSAPALFTATKHVAGNAPCTSAALNATLTWGNAGGGIATGTTANTLLAPTGTLTGSWYVINVPETTTFSGATTAIVARGAATVPVFSPQANGPAVLTTADPLMNAVAPATPIIPAQLYDVPDLSTPYFGALTTASAQALELTTTLARASVINQYANDAEVSAKTDWVFSLPTRRYSVAANYAVAPTATGYRVFNTTAGFTYFTAANTSVNAIGQICLASISATFYDREETSRTEGAVFSPGTRVNTALCGEVNVLSFADTGASVLGGAVARANVSGVYTNGWGEIVFGGSGVPAIGASFVKVSNPAARPGLSGNYGITWPHSYRGVTAVN